MSGENPPNERDVARATRLKELRQRTELTQEEFARAAGIDRTRYVKAETGADKLTSDAMLAAIAKAVGAQPMMIFGYLRGDCTVDEVLASRAGSVPVRTVEMEERYPTVAVIFADARASKKYSEELLRSAATRLGVFKTEPTSAQVWEAIADALRGAQKAEEVHTKVHQRAQVASSETSETEAERALHRAPQVVAKKAKKKPSR